MLPSSELEPELEDAKTLFLVEVTGPPLLTTVLVNEGLLKVVTLLLRTDKRSLPVRTSLLVSSKVVETLLSVMPLPVLVMVEGKLRKMLLELVELVVLAGIFSWGTGLDRPTTSTATLLNILKHYQ